MWTWPVLCRGGPGSTSGVNFLFLHPFLSPSPVFLSLPATALLDVLCVLLISGDTNGALHMDTEAHPPSNFVAGGRPSSTIDGGGSVRRPL